MSDTVSTVGRVGAHDIGKEVILRHGDSHIRGILQNITHDVEKIEEKYLDDTSHTYYRVTSTLDISGVVVYGVSPEEPINTDLFGS